MYVFDFSVSSRKTFLKLYKSTNFSSNTEWKIRPSVPELILMLSKSFLTQAISIKQASYRDTTTHANIEM